MRIAACWLLLVVMAVFATGAQAHGKPFFMHDLPVIAQPSPDTTITPNTTPSASKIPSDLPIGTPRPIASSTPKPTKKPNPTSPPYNNPSTIVALSLLQYEPIAPVFQPREGYDYQYALEVDIQNQCVNVYIRGESGLYDLLINRFVTSSGTAFTSTPLGKFYIPFTQKTRTTRFRWADFRPKYDVFAQYAVRINGSILFHSILYKKPNISTVLLSSYYALGNPASHGCMRLMPAHAKWIYENIPDGTFVSITNSKKTNSALKAALKPPPYVTPSSTPKPTFAPTPTPMPTGEPTPTPEVTPTPSYTPTPTPSADPTPTPTATLFPTPSPTLIPTLAPTSMPTG